MLKTIDEEPETPTSHALYVLELYYHIKLILQDNMINLFPEENKRYLYVKYLSTLFYLSPPTPPPKLS